MNKMMRMALVNVSATVLYIALVASFMYYGSEVKIGRNNTLLIPIAMLLLLTFSAALTGFLIFGRAALMYFDGKKKDAITLLGYTLGLLSLVTVIAVLALVVFTK